MVIKNDVTSVRIEYPAERSLLISAKSLKE